MTWHENEFREHVENKKIKMLKQNIIKSEFTKHNQPTECFVSNFRISIV